MTRTADQLARVIRYAAQNGVPAGPFRDYLHGLGLPARAVDALLADKCSDCGVNGAAGLIARAATPQAAVAVASVAPPPGETRTLADLHARVKASSVLRDLAAGCEHAVAAGPLSAPALVALAAAKRLTVVSPEPPAFLRTLARFAPGVAHATDVPAGADLLYSPTPRPDGTDRYLVTTDPDALLPFLRSHLGFVVVRQADGLAVLSRAEADRKAEPGNARKALNFLHAKAKHAAGGERKLTPEAAGKRLDVCIPCEHRVSGQCSACGCPLAKKVTWNTEDCGLVKLGLPPKWTKTTDERDLIPAGNAG